VGIVSNALCPILVTVLGIVMLVKLEPKNALASMVLTVYTFVPSDTVFGNTVFAGRFPLTPVTLA
jgi:hypothetical protein